jgi:predicted RNA-binding Zn ribbon-like protein
MEATETNAAQQKLVGGRLCLDFINTVDWHASEHPEEYLTSYQELVAWSLHASILNETEGQQLLTEAALRPDEANTTLAAVIAFREALYRIFLATLTETAPGADDLALFNATRAHALAQSEIAAADQGFVWRWKVGKDALDWMLWPITLSAADVLLSPDLRQLKECPGPDCGWLFLDTSKNHTRRWCTMEGCGNRAKARSHYQRKRQSAQTGERS